MIRNFEESKIASPVFIWSNFIDAHEPLRKLLLLLFFVINYINRMGRAFNGQTGDELLKEHNALKIYGIFFSFGSIYDNNIPCIGKWRGRIFVRSR